MLATLRRGLLLLPSAMRWRWAMLVPFTLLSAVLETLGAAAVFLLIKILTDPAQVGVLPLPGRLATLFQGPAESSPVVPVFTLFMMLFYITKNSLLVWTAYLRSRIASYSAARVAQSLLIGYLNDSYAHHLRRSSAELIRNALDSTEVTFRLVLNSAVNVATETLIVAGMTIFLLTASPLAALVTIAVLLIILIVLLRLTRNVSVGWGAQEQKLKQAGLQSLQHSLGGIREIKVMGREDFFIDTFSRIQARLAQVRTWQMTLTIGSGILVETLFAGGLLLIVMLILTQESGSSRDIVPLLGLYGYVGFRVIPSINRILMNVQYIRHGAAAVDHLWADFTAFGNSPVRETAAADDLTFFDRLSLERVCYTYEEASRPALEDISLTIHYGESIGVVGPTGSGKSTLINLILGLLPPTQGWILVDGQDIQNHLPAWRRKIGYVPQDVFLIDDTLRHNIAFGLAEDDIDPDRIQAAVRMAQLTEFVASLPEQLNTVVGEGGVRLSGGQRQRVAIARALYHDPELIIFDEATSALDTQTELAVSQAMQALQGKKTLIIIAHRLSTVRHCDHLLFVQDGRNADYGSFEELMNSNPAFRMMAAGSLRLPVSKET